MRNWMLEQRKQLNLTQQEVADQTSVTRQMIAAIESGDANPSVTVAKEIAAVLGCDWTLFFEEPDNPPSPPRRKPLP